MSLFELYILGIVIAVILNIIMLYMDVQDGEVITRKDFAAITFLLFLSWLNVIAAIMAFGEIYFKKYVKNWKNWWNKPVFGGDK